MNFSNYFQWVLAIKIDELRQILAFILGNENPLHLISVEPFLKSFLLMSAFILYCSVKVMFGHYQTFELVKIYLDDSS